ncbi:MAG: O-antigen ligase family protein [Clostridia bacterium]|nr:O-antigen ligase family protein [Clostridia bacterium]
MDNIQRKQKWSWTTGNMAIFSLAIYIATVFVFSSNEELNIISQAAFFVMCACSFLYILTEKRAFYVNGTVLWLFGLFLLAFASLSWSMDVTYGTGKIITLVQLIILCIFANVIIDTPYKVSFTINSIIFSGYVMYFYTFATIGIDGVLSMLADEVRIGGNVNQENAFGYYSAIVFAFALYQFIYNKKRWQIVFLPLPVLMGLMSGSKKCLLLLLVATFLLIALKDKKKLITRAAFALAIIALLAFILYRLGVMELVLNRFDDALQGKDTSTIKRQLYIDFGLEKIKERPILGYGIEQYGLLFEQTFGSFHPSHNNYIQIAVSFGIIGLSFWYGAYVYFLIVGVKHFYKNNMAPLLVFITLMTFVNDITTTTLLNKFTYVLLALCFAIASLIKKEANEGK